MTLSTVRGLSEDERLFLMWESTSMHRIHRAFAVRSRERKIRMIRDFVLNRNIKSVLVVGASANGSGYGNMIERALVEMCPDTVMSGLEKDSSVWENWLSVDGRSLPFPEKSFDLVVSNAVIEHVGGRPDQITFASEHRRVGINWLWTTPNRFFPIELHSGVLLRHISGRWKPDSVSRLLNRKDLVELCEDSDVKGHLFSPTFTVYGPVSR